MHSDEAHHHQCNGSIRQASTTQLRKSQPHNDLSQQHVHITHPSCLALILDGFFRVGYGPIHELLRVFHIVLDPINHFSL
ncbi:hypothetical protein Y032_0944g3151 [Ancylostoma ceylanicum]|uniref:Uncharacterized protein n=1 Tax=Ancylostoma ceylanicum TaxID=53326 RepID=A0A016W885_9BILA|nr:hypothetical protein Y032_0944g3151 [Ancylostoma ceylanicum]